ncbi:LRR-like disease resistance protein [Raphanus sativus]|uniref:Disease resistance protein RML1B-like n=1 Tax=Raphanus sativus TaxID=3726 RepID=A0A6J0L1I0_RAPSA|nr:disease resistance protein RML1B-like [Raphanus sativus]KAJ4877267.1 LRR-like disease resistance protein [Raphanus sativus]
MSNLRFHKVYKSKYDGEDILRIPEETEFPSGLRLLHWKVYPSKCLPLGFCLNNLVELKMRHSHLEKLWEGTQALANLKRMDLSWYFNLKEIPDFSNTTMLESLVLCGCKNLVEIHSSVGSLRKLEFFQMCFCSKLQVVLALFNLAPLAYVGVEGCSQLRNFSDISTNIRTLSIADTMLEELSKSVRHWSALQSLALYGDSANIKRIERVPDCFKELHGLVWICVAGCPKLASLPELPASLKTLIVKSCKSLKTVSLDFDSELSCNITNCFKLGREARRVIQQSLRACLPGRKIPAKFDHRTIGNSLTVRSDFREFWFCVVVSRKQYIGELNPEFFCRIRLEQENENMFEFITCQELDIIACGVQIMTEESERRRMIEFDEASKASQDSRKRLICD